MMLMVCPKCRGLPVVYARAPPVATSPTETTTVSCKKKRVLGLMCWEICKADGKVVYTGPCRKPKEQGGQTMGAPRQARVVMTAEYPYPAGIIGTTRGVPATTASVPITIPGLPAQPAVYTYRAPPKCYGAKPKCKWPLKPVCRAMYGAGPVWHCALW